MESNYKKIAIASILAITVSLFLSGSGLFFGSVAKADDDSILADGAFLVIPDLNSISLTPIRNKCLLEINGELIFTGTLEGAALGTTRALVFASCENVANNPPGTFPDVFRSELVFDGTVNDIPTITDITYQGITKAGGDIKALMRLSNGVEGLLKVDALVLVGGSYSGFIESEGDDDD